MHADGSWEGKLFHLFVLLLHFEIWEIVLWDTFAYRICLFSENIPFFEPFDDII